MRAARTHSATPPAYPHAARTSHVRPHLAPSGDATGALKRKGVKRERERQRTYISRSFSDPYTSFGTRISVELVRTFSDPVVFATLRLYRYSLLSTYCTNSRSRRSLSNLYYQFVPGSFKEKTLSYQPEQRRHQCSSSQYHVTVMVVTNLMSVSRAMPPFI